MFIVCVLGAVRLISYDFVWVLSCKLTYPLYQGTFEDDFPFLQVGCVNCLQGIDSAGSKLNQANNFEP